MTIDIDLVSPTLPKLSQSPKPKRATLTGDPFQFLVEAAGVELVC
jgi:hypothetical protein